MSDSRKKLDELIAALPVTEALKLEFRKLLDEFELEKFTEGQNDILDAEFD